jgi:membrane protein YqaA with SNARE-associated domain
MPCDTVLISGAVGILGTTIGAFFTYQFSRKVQREQWVRDTKKQEYRELLTTLTEAYGMICVLQQPGRAFGIKRPETLRGNSPESAKNYP